MLFQDEVSRHDSDRVKRAKRSVWEADESCVFASLNGAAYDLCLAVRAGLEEFAMPRVRPADQNR